MNTEESNDYSSFDVIIFFFIISDGHYIGVFTLHFLGSPAVLRDEGRSVINDHPPHPWPDPNQR